MAARLTKKCQSSRLTLAWRSSLPCIGNIVLLLIMPDSYTMQESHSQDYKILDCCEQPWWSPVQVCSSMPVVARHSGSTSKPCCYCFAWCVPRCSSCVGLMLSMHGLACKPWLGCNRHGCHCCFIIGILVWPGTSQKACGGHMWPKGGNQFSWGTLRVIMKRRLPDW